MTRAEEIQYWTERGYNVVDKGETKVGDVVSTGSKSYYIGGDSILGDGTIITATGLWCFQKEEFREIHEAENRAAIGPQILDRLGL